MKRCCVQFLKIIHVTTLEFKNILTIFSVLFTLLQNLEHGKMENKAANVRKYTDVSFYQIKNGIQEGFLL